MEKSKLLTLSVIGLLVINMATLGFLFLNGPRGNRPPHDDEHQKPREIIIDKLHFDANQQKEYDQIIKVNQDEVRRLDTNIRETKQALYTQLSKPEINTKTKDSLTACLTEYQKQIEETHFNHFEAIKKLCHPDQLDDYNELTNELGRIFAPNRPPRREHE
jgi:protein CpxP